MASLIVRLPAITTEMESGYLLKWLVNVGDSVKEGDPICEFTTDKVDTELESPYTGTITQLLVAADDEVAVGDAIATIEGEGGDLLDGLLPSDSVPTTQEEPESQPVSPEPETPNLTPAESGDKAVQPEILAPRAIRLLAQERGIDLSQVTATGSRGQITVEDLDRIQPGTSSPTTSPIDSPAPQAVLRNQGQLAGDHRAERRPRAERTGGRRRRQGRNVAAQYTAPVVQESVTPVIQEVRVEETSEPPCTLFAQVDITDLIDDQSSGLALLSRVVWAYGQALWMHSEANVTWDNHTKSTTPVGTVFIDVGVETPSATMETLPVAVPLDATINQVGESVAHGYCKIRQGEAHAVIAPQRSGSLIDLGPWHIERVTPVLQPPQVTALSIGEIQTAPSLVGRTVTIRQTITLGLTIDTRILDPVQAATLLASIVAHLTNGEDV